MRTFAATLNACARPVREAEKDDALGIAQLAMNELSSGTYGKHNFLSFAAFLCVCASTLEPGEKRDAIVKKFFQQCVEAQMVGQTVIEKLYSAASPELFDSLHGKYRDAEGRLIPPRYWSAATKGERPGGNVFPGTVGHSGWKGDVISESSQRRLDAVESLRDKHVAKLTSEEGIEWSTKSLSSKQKNKF